jgi:hypothetical protein
VCFLSVAVNLMVSSKSQAGEARQLYFAKMMRHTRREAAQTTTTTLRKFDSCHGRFGRCPPVFRGVMGIKGCGSSSVAEQRLPNPRIEGSIPSCRVGLPADPKRRQGHAAEWDGPHLTVNSDS